MGVLAEAALADAGVPEPVQRGPLLLPVGQALRRQFLTPDHAQPRRHGSHHPHCPAHDQRRRAHLPTAGTPLVRTPAAEQVLQVVVRPGLSSTS